MEFIITMYWIEEPGLGSVEGTKDFNFTGTEEEAEAYADQLLYNYGADDYVIELAN